MRNSAGFACPGTKGAMILGASLAWGLSAGTSLAHGGALLNAENAWTTWNWSPEVLVLSLLTMIVYLRGMARRRLVRQPPSRTRHVLFLAGVGVVFLALQSPVDPIAGRLFTMHQAQHLLLRMLGPMLIALAGPEAVLVAGLPSTVRRRILAPILSSSALQSVFAILARPTVAFLVFLASLYFWQIPAIHNAALQNAAIHYAMHASMLAAGLLFFWLMFDRREAPAGISYPVRLLMLIGTIVSNILIGSVTTLKEVVFYTAYDVDGRLFGFAPLADEAAGGYTIWVPASMMCLIAILIVLHGWAKQEERRYIRSQDWSASNFAALENPQTAEELRIKVKRPNRSAAMTLAATSLSMFVLTLSTAIIIILLF